MFHLCSASVVKEPGVYWEGISVTLGCKLYLDSFEVFHKIMLGFLPLAAFQVLEFSKKILFGTESCFQWLNCPLNWFFHHALQCMC